MKKLFFLCLLVFLGLFIPIEPWSAGEHHKFEDVETMDLSAYSRDSIQGPLDLLFIHHSCGGHLLADPGEETGENCIFETHPLGGGLRSLLRKNGYVVHEASYESKIGHHTDIFDWPDKFAGQMSQILACSHQDETFGDQRFNRVVVFKSCYPNNKFRGEGAPPGNPKGPELLVWNAKAAYNALKEEFIKQPRTLFVCMTAPPLAPKQRAIPIWKMLAKKLLGRDFDLIQSGNLAREFNNWLKDKDGWLKGYEGKNVATFDFFNVLTGHGRSNLSIYPTCNGVDSHPDQKGNEAAAQEFIGFLNQAIRRAGIMK